MAVDWAKFATEVHPLHPSGLAALMHCPWKVAMRFVEHVDDEGGAAGDTGSAMHIAVAEFHRGKETAACIESMHENVAKYPQADLLDAARLFLTYIVDPINVNAKLLLIEHPIAFTIAPAEEDQTQTPISVIGTVDQVRETRGQAYVWDLKTSKNDAISILNATTLQMAAYCVGASVALNMEVNPGGIILARRYPRNPFFWYSWRFKDIESILAGIRHTVARVRAGDVWHNPGYACDWCHAKTPDLCLPKLQELRCRG